MVDITPATPTKIELTNSTGFPRRYTCASGVAINKGAFLKLNDNRTVTTSTGTGDVFAGIAAMDKSATNDDSTTITAITDGVYDVYASGGITVGEKVKTASTGNMVMTATLNDISSNATNIICGYALQTASDKEVIAIRISV